MVNIKKGATMRRNEIILLVSLIVNLLVWTGTWIWAGAVFTKKVEANTIWIEKNEKLPACVEANEKWISRNKDLPTAVLTNQIDLRYFGKEMQKLTDQLEAVNKNLTWFKNYRKGQNNDPN